MCRISHMQIYTHFHIKYVFLWIPNYSFKVAYAHFKPNFVRTQFLHHMSSVINISHLGPLVCWKPRQSECSMFCLFNLIVCLTKCYGSQQQQHQQQQQQQWSRRLKHTAKWIAFFFSCGFTAMRKRGKAISYTWEQLFNTNLSRETSSVGRGGRKANGGNTEKIIEAQNKSTAPNYSPREG